MKESTLGTITAQQHVGYHACCAEVTAFAFGFMAKRRHAKTSQHRIFLHEPFMVWNMQPCRLKKRLYLSLIGRQVRADIKTAQSFAHHRPATALKCKALIKGALCSFEDFFLPPLNLGWNKSNINAAIFFKNPPQLWNLNRLLLSVFFFKKCLAGLFI